MTFVIPALNVGQTQAAITCVLHAGGIGFTNSFLHEVLETDFVHIGPAVIWSPYFIIGATLVEIPLFLWLTVRAYCRREC